MIDKPKFTVDQVIPASKAAKKFAEVRKNAKLSPQFISQNNSIDSVVQSYEDYERMYMELETLRELVTNLKLSDRIQEGAKRHYTLQEVMGDKAYAEFQKIDPNIISDEDLFE